MSVKTVFCCSQCGHEEPKWVGRCPGCGEWNTFKEFKKDKSGSVASKRIAPVQPVKLSEIIIEDKQRTATSLSELDRVLGGGFLPGMIVLIGGEPGIGKSTLMLQTASSLSSSQKVLYISGEETAAQIKHRADRLEISSPLDILCETRLEQILECFTKECPDVLIIDSLQTIYSERAGTVPGTVNQLKLAASELSQACKTANCVLILLAHVTKDGTIAGPKTVEHIVDTVLTFDSVGNDVRALKPVKNRFGATDEIGLFYMKKEGLIQVENPSSVFLEPRENNNELSGISICTVYEGTRVLLAEIQALTVPAKSSSGRVYSEKIEPLRVSRIAAILEKHLRLQLSDQDIYVNVTGGLKIQEAGCDLPLAMALYTARTGQSISGNTALLGELTLSGEIRPLPFQEKRINALLQMGFGKILAPIKTDGKNSKTENVNKIQDLLEKLL